MMVVVMTMMTMMTMIMMLIMMTITMVMAMDNAGDDGERCSCRVDGVQRMTVMKMKMNKR